MHTQQQQQQAQPSKRRAGRVEYLTLRELLARDFDGPAARSTKAQ